MQAPSAVVPSHVWEAVRDLRRLVEARFGTRLVDVRLFGSHARGEQRPGSDVDILVVIEGLGAVERSQVYAATELDEEAATQAASEAREVRAAVREYLEAGGWL